METIYTDPALTALYDTLNPAGEDTDFYLRCARSGDHILDVGCGTGLTALHLARHGYSVTGVEPAAAMLAIARQNDVGRQVGWVQADARTLDLADRFDLAIMTGHVFQVFSADEARAVLEGVFRHLRDGGRLVFDSRNPLHRAWETWTPQLSARRVHVDGFGIVEVYHAVTAVEGEWVSFVSEHRFLDTGALKSSRSRLRFPAASEIEAVLSEAGFTGIELYGNWLGGQWTPDSAEIIACARKS
ncbi:methyltransferase domain-containing protein [Rhizobium sp. LjRoot30]|uniref:class I SAM-dependent methyltransferase n=1 Tax=Rhizobium sp. LjRoot30 TaxID=3342320 RepID=UPI003ECCCFA5